MFQTAQEALKYIVHNDIAMIDLKIAGVAGQWLHITIPAGQFTQKHFEEGVGYDGSSGAGFAKVESGDVAARPQPETAFVDPFFEHATLSFVCETVAADTKAPFPSDPRTIATRALKYLRATGVADEAWMGPEFEFHVFDRVSVICGPYHTAVDIHCGEVDSEGRTSPIPAKQGYLRTPPSEHLHNFRGEVALMLEQMGVSVRYHHHEVGAPGQCEIEVDLMPLVRAADQTMLIKYVIKNVARRAGKLATFMPKPVFGEAGNGMHVHQRLTQSGRPVFYDRDERNYANLSQTALRYIGGLLAHGRALTGLTNPSTNSFKRLVPGYEAPVNLFFSLANRSAAIRVPRYAVSPDDKRIEYRPPDFSGNIYLTLAAMLMAGVDGIQSAIDHAAENRGPFDVDIAQQSDEFRRAITPLPDSLDAALAALAEDHAFLTAGEVFPAELIQAWIETKQNGAARPLALRPHPYEYELYLDV